MTTYWLIGQDLTPARLNAWTSKRNKSFTPSVQELDFFRSNPKLSSRRGSSRRSGSFIEPTSPCCFRHDVKPTTSLPTTSSAVAFAINGQFSTIAKRNLAQLLNSRIQAAAY